MIIDTYNFQVVNGVAYKKEMPAEAIKALEDARKAGTRIVITYGDTITGRKWKGLPIIGYVSSSHLQLPILLHRKRADGGECIKTSAILEIKECASKKILYAWKIDKSLIVEEVFEAPLMNETGLLLPMEEEAILPMEGE